MIRALLVALLCTFLALPAAAQDTTAPETDRSATGGAQTLDDIMRRQEGLPVAPRGDADIEDTAAGMANQLGTLGGASDSAVWRALRYGHDTVEVSAGGDVARVLMQDGGMKWWQYRDGPMSRFGAYLLLGTIGALALFFLLRGRVPLDEPETGRTVTRFKAFERFSHWMLAGSFIILGLSGLLVKYGRDYVAPLIGKEANAMLLTGAKYAHNNLAWPFMLALICIFFLWVWHNIPNRTDITWIAQFGGIVGKKHPPAKKFNAGQKIIFWSVILLGGSISISGLSLLFPYELPLFAKTFTVLNDIGITALFGMDPLPVELAPQEEMQLAATWHALVGFVLMAIIVAHIYIGSVGMEGAFAAMGTGEVDEAWAHQHHSLWLEEVQAKQAEAPEPGAATPAE